MEKEELLKELSEIKTVKMPMVEQILNTTMALEIFAKAAYTMRRGMRNVIY